MHVLANAIVLTVRPHGEHGAVVRALTPENGLLAGYVRGGRSRRLRPILSVGNIVAAAFRARSETQLASLTVELVVSRAPLLAEPLAAAAIEWVTALPAVVLPEGHPYPNVHAMLDAMLIAIEAAPAARVWIEWLARYEAAILAELGYGSDASTLNQTGDRLHDHLLTGRRGDILPARGRLIDRIERAMGR